MANSKKNTIRLQKLIEITEANLWSQCQRLALTFSTTDRNNIIKTTIRLKTLKQILNEQY